MFSYNFGWSLVWEDCLFSCYLTECLSYLLIFRNQQNLCLSQYVKKYGTFLNVTRLIFIFTVHRMLMSFYEWCLDSHHDAQVERCVFFP